MTDPDADSDRGLLRRIADGDQAAWGALVDRYSLLIRSVAQSHGLSPSETSDVVQEVWLRVVEDADRIADPDRLRGWLVPPGRENADAVT